MTRDQVASEKTKVRLDTASAHDDAAGWDDLPADFRELVNRSLSLQARVRRLDEEIYGSNVRHLASQSIREGSPVSDQLSLLRTVFARG
jgi:regulator of CtrA degradation